MVVVNLTASNNCFSHINVFQLIVNALLKMVKKKQKEKQKEKQTRTPPHTPPHKNTLFCQKQKI